MARDDRRQSKSDRRSASPPPDRGVFMISVAAELAGMHPQTLRVYEARGLIKPERSPKGTRLYSQHDVDSLKRIQELTTSFGMTLAGVERVMALERRMNAMRAQLEDSRKLAERMQREMLERIDEVHRSYKRELVPWQPPEQALGISRTKRGVRIHIERADRAQRKPGGPNAA
jgi:MerR family transcriptional regulator, heat shock protein HspR